MESLFEWSFFNAPLWHHQVPLQVPLPIKQARYDKEKCTGTVELEKRPRENMDESFPQGELNFKLWENRNWKYVELEV